MENEKDGGKEKEATVDEETEIRETEEIGNKKKRKKRRKAFQHEG